MPISPVKGKGGDPVGGRGHLAERAQLAAYDDQADRSRGGDAEQGQQHLPADETAQHVVDLAGGQADHDGHGGPLDSGDAVLAERGQVDGVDIAIGGHLRQRGEPGGGDGTQGRRGVAGPVGDHHAVLSGPLEDRRQRADTLPSCLAGSVAPAPVVQLVRRQPEAGGAEDRAGAALRRRQHPGVELVGEVAAHGEGGRGRDQHTGEGDERDHSRDQPSGERGRDQSDSAGFST